MSIFPVALLRSDVLDGLAWLSPALQWAPYLLLSLAVAAVIAMHLTLKREMAAQAQRNRRVEAMLSRLREATSGLREATSGGGDLSTPRGGTNGDDLGLQSSGFVPGGPRPGMNLSRRVQALRLLRRGEELGHIASALGVPRCEVELLVRVHKLAMAAAASESPPLPLAGRVPAALST